MRILVSTRSSDRASAQNTEHKAHQGLFAVQTSAANCSKQLPHLPMHQAHEGNKIRLLALDLSPITTCYAITSQRLTPHKLAREVHPASASERYANGATQSSTGFNTWIDAGCASFHTLANWSWYLRTASQAASTSCPQSTRLPGLQQHAPTSNLPGNGASPAHATHTHSTNAVSNKVLLH